MKSWSLTFATQMLFRRSGSEFSTHSRILFSSEYFHYKIFIHEKCLENKNYKFQARRLRNTGLEYPLVQWLSHTKRSARKDITGKKIWSWWYFSEREVFLCPFEIAPSLHTLGRQLLHSFIPSLTTP